ncbi:MAG: oligosaccharide flippase family protein [Gemmataceae bacterium]
MSVATLIHPGAPQIAFLRRAAFRGLGWSGLGQLLGLIIRLASNLILTRLLAPEDYGLLGSAMVVLTTLEWLSDLGINPALLRHPHGDRVSFLQTGWWLGLLRGVGLTAVTALVAVPLTLFWKQPALLPVLLALSVRPILLALRSPGLILLRRRLQYRALFVDELAQTLVGTAVSILLAYLTHSVWAMVAGTLVGALTAILASYCLSGMVPAFYWDRVAVREFAGLGQQVLFNTLVMALWLNLDRLLGVRLISLEAMGCYFIAMNLASIAEALLSRGCEVHFSLLVRLDETERDEHQDRILERITRFGLPVAALLVALAPLVCQVLYDPRYRPAGMLLAVLLARLMFRFLGQMQFQTLLAAGKVHHSTLAYGIALVVQVLTLPLLALKAGPMGLALSCLISTATWALTQTWLIPGQGPMGTWRLLVAALYAVVAIPFAWVLR